MGHPSEAVTKVCLFSRVPRPGAGDLIQRNIFLRLLREAFPHATVTWVVGRNVTSLPFQDELVRRHSYADDVLQCPDPEVDDPDGWQSFVAELDERRFEVCVVDPRSFRLGVADAARAGIAVRVALPTGGDDDALITHPMRPRWDPDRTPDLYDYATALATTVGVPLDAPPTQIVPRPPMRPEELPAWARQRPLVGIHPACSKGWHRRWPLNSFTQVVARLTGQLNATVVIVGAADEAEEASRIVREVLRDNPHARLHVLLGAGANTLLNLIDRLDLLVGNDSGPAHLAAAVATPTVVIYGPDDEELMWKRVYAVHRGVNKHYPCQLRDNEPNRWDGQCALGCPCDYVAAEGPYPRCLADITVDDVWPEVTAQLDLISPHAG
jgi:ADP-heptose:LPS heptosyltransferase